jgi:hypothetical protein
LRRKTIPHWPPPVHLVSLITERMGAGSRPVRDWLRFWRDRCNRGE